MDRRTVAPAPSDCSRARKVLRIARGVVMMLDVFVLMEAAGVMKGRAFPDSSSCITEVYALEAVMSL